MSEFAIFDAHPTAAFRAESPLSICRITVATQPAAQGAGVVLRECAFLGHLILRGNAADEAFRAGVEVALGVPLPLKVGPVSRDELVVGARGGGYGWGFAHLAEGCDFDEFRGDFAQALLELRLA